MKKILLSFILMLSLVGLTGCQEQPSGDNKTTTGDNTPVVDNPTQDTPVVQPDNQNSTNTISIQDNRGTKEIEIDGIKVKDVIIVNENNKRVEFTLEGENLPKNMTVELSLIGETVVNKSMSLTIGNENIKYLAIDLTNEFNNPTQIKFNITKN